MTDAEIEKLDYKNDVDAFETMLRSTKREGIESLIKMLRDSDFYTAPASTKYHLSCKGGLLAHSLHVMSCLMEKKTGITWGQHLSGVGEDTFILVSLLHDICKTYYYDIEYRNKKVYSESGSKQDEGGAFDWKSVPEYKINDKVPYGHGEKSVMMIEQYIRLKPMERMAIRWHMGFTEPKELWGSLGEAMKKYPLVLALHASDMEATYLLEKEQ